MPDHTGISKIIDKVTNVGKDKGKDDGCTNWIVVQIKNLKDSSTTKQTVVGASAGLLTGYATGKLGRTVGYMIGGTILLVNIANRAGYIKINWNEMNSDIEQAKKELGKKAEKELPKLLEKAKDFVSENIVLAGSYIGGFLIGLSSS